MNPHPNDPKGESGSKKTPLQLLPPHALAQIALAHKEGSERYGPWNWRQTGVCATTYIGAIMRHLAAWQDGEDIDPDSGLSHIAKIGACCNILLDAEHCGKLVDDRSKVCEHADVVEARRKMQESLKSVEKKVRASEIIYRLTRELKDLKMKTKAMNEPQIPDGLPPLPPVPEGYDRWEYRGMGWRCKHLAMYGCAAVGDPDWGEKFSGWEDPARPRGDERYHYIEAVKDSGHDTAKPLDPLDILCPPPPHASDLPEGHSKWEYRGRKWRCDSRREPPWYVNVGCPNATELRENGGKPMWRYEDPVCKWPEGMGWYYEAVR